MKLSQGRTVTDTSDFMAIEPGDVILVGGRRYMVRGEEREYRFGVEDPKFWVKKVIDLQTQERKLIKLAYAETFMTQLGGVQVRCFRNSAKESAILDLVTGHPSFMQGINFTDDRGNPVRVLEIVRGVNFLNYIDSFKMPHEVYFWTVLPDILRNLIGAIQAIGFLHTHGFRHGDIRNDHVIVTHGTGKYVWIDFDYDFDLPENPFGLDVFGLGNLLIYAIGKGFHEYYMIRNDRYVYQDLAERVTMEDFSILHTSRLVNLRIFFPYIPPFLNNVLLHFSKGAPLFYENTRELVEDLQGFLTSV